MIPVHHFLTCLFPLAIFVVAPTIFALSYLEVKVICNIKITALSMVKCIFHYVLSINDFDFATKSTDKIKNGQRIQLAPWPFQWQGFLTSFALN